MKLISTPNSGVTTQNAITTAFDFVIKFLIGQTFEISNEPPPTMLHALLGSFLIGPESRMFHPKMSASVSRAQREFDLAFIADRAMSKQAFAGSSANTLQSITSSPHPTGLFLR